MDTEVKSCEHCGTTIKPDDTVPCCSAAQRAEDPTAYLGFGNGAVTPSDETPEHDEGQAADTSDNGHSSSPFDRTE